MKKRKFIRVIVVVIICILILMTFAFGTFKIVRYIGNKSLENNATSSVPVMPDKDNGDAEKEKEITTDNSLKEGEVLYKGNKYKYKSDIRSFLIMGIDEAGTMDDLLAQKTGGQSDMLFLAVVDPYEKAIKLIGINRNTMTEIQRCDENLEYYDTVIGQITLQHAYGTGGADSCEKTVAAVDKLMYMVPIHGYYAMNMGAIVLLNDAIGGVEVTALETIEKGNVKITEGEKVTLLGQTAYYYAKYRDYKKPGTADKRLERQKQYLKAFAKKTMKMVKSDLALPLNLFNIVNNYSTTNITIDEMTYLTSQAVNYNFNTDEVISIPGETIHPEDKEYEEFWVDEDALYEMILEIFYEQE